MRLHSEPELLAIKVLQGISDPNVIKLIPRISLLTLLELHGKSTYPVVKYAVDIERLKKKSIYPINVCNFSVTALEH